MNQQQPRMFGDLNVDQRSFELLSKLDAYGQLHFDTLVDEFVQSFTTYCEQIVHMQQAGHKQAIAFINFSVLKTNLLTRKHELRMDAYDENWYLDRVACTGTYDVSPFYRWLYTFADNLEATRKKYRGKLTFAQMQALIFEESHRYLIFVAELMRVAIKKVVKTAVFKQLNRHEVFVICIGEYQDRVDILYKEDSTVKDAKVVKRYLEKGKGQADPFTYEICENVDLSKGDFADLNILFSSFAGCDFTDTSFEATLLLMTSFKDATLKNTTLKKAQIFDGDFTGATLENVDFKDAKLKHVIFKNATLINVTFDDALLLTQLNFEGATLIDTDIPIEKGVS
ncbi:MAG: pentapeptide repeat-containing protein [Defluviitaleaceae bacterium]|nr:pentapeptide repeat-containing protein [Defluviitaleaceae bacterium]